MADPFSDVQVTGMHRHEFARRTAGGTVALPQHGADEPVNGARLQVRRESSDLVVEQAQHDLAALRLRAHKRVEAHAGTLSWTVDDKTVAPLEGTPR